MPMIMKIGTRSSLMARQQAFEIQHDLSNLHPEVIFQQVDVSTRGDRDRQRDLAEFKRPGIFTTGLERALYEGQVDLAVHSFKDLPTEQHPGLVIGAVTARQDPADALVTRSGQGLKHLKDGALIGTCSPRRQRLLASLGRHFRCVPVRGNIDTRIRNMDENSTCEALMVAFCGLERLGLSARATHRFEATEFLTAPAQGALAIQCRASDAVLLNLLAPLDHACTRLCANAERSLLIQLGGGCSLAIAALGQLINGKIELQGAVLSADGHRRIYGMARDENPEKAAAQVAEDMIEQGCLSWL